MVTWVLYHTNDDSETEPFVHFMLWQTVIKDG